MPSRRSRRQFLRRTGHTVGVGFTAATAGCSTRTLFSGVNVHFRTPAVDAPPLGLLSSGVWLVAAGRDGAVVGMDHGDGEMQWRVDTGDDLTVSPVEDDGSVYTAGATVASVDSGTVRWRTPLPVVASALTVVPDRAVVAAGTEDGRVVAVNADDGEFVDSDDGDRIWEARLSADRDVRVDALATDGERLYAGSRDGVAVAFDARTGAVQWRIDAVVSAIASTGARTLLGRRRVTGVQDGAVQWRVATGNNWTTEIASTSWWYLVGTRADGDGYVLSLTHDGERRWRSRLTGDGVALTPVVNGQLVVGVEGERPGVHQFTTEGESAWFFETETSVVDVVYTGDWT